MMGFIINLKGGCNHFIMSKNDDYKSFREQYPKFIYRSYNISEDKDKINLDFVFEIPGLATFYPHLDILKKDFKFKPIDSKLVQNMAFSVGMVELISYWKCACPPNVEIDCGSLTPTQIKWWKKLYFNGLSELFYRNEIENTYDDFMHIESTSDEDPDDRLYVYDDNDFNGYIVPIGGGKDSCVTLETIKLHKKSDYCLIVNPKPVTLECAKIAGFDRKNVIEINRVIDKTLIDLNAKGFINGHTPFSAMLAFTSYLVGFLLSKKYIALSNENSANESNVRGKKVNHQYSKSFEFEDDFRKYVYKYLPTPVEYFSFLRPLNELQIAKLFAKLPQYHSTFKSCNEGSKAKDWIWCCNCAKCLFAYTILSPYLYTPGKKKNPLVDIFGEDLFQKESMKDTLLQLVGKVDVKPFDCVGTFEEVNFALTKTIQNLEADGVELPLLLQAYKDECGMVDTTEDITLRYNDENNLTPEQKFMLKDKLF
jgi:hypothetical protein